MRALFSVRDTSGLAEFAGGLAELGYDLAATDETARALASAGIDAALARSGADDPAGADADLYVANLTLPDGGLSLDRIDVDGPARLRRAAQDYERVVVVTDPSDYEEVLDELRRDGALCEATRKRLARAALAHAAAYDAAAITALDEVEGTVLPPTLHVTLERAQDLRYGENPHQQGARYREAGRESWWDGVEQFSGMALSYLNIFDADAAWKLVHDLGDEPAAAIIKHANPCGVAVDKDIATAYARAFECDPTSAFGGIVALNRPVDAELAAEMVANPKADVLIAPGYAPEAAALFAKKRKNMRVLAAPLPLNRDRYTLRRVDGGFLVQEIDRVLIERDRWRVVTKVAPTEVQWREMEFAWRVCAYVTSNAIVFTANGQAVGIGAGQQSRVDSAEIAERKADGRARGGACASDALFPFRDGLDAAARAGVASVIQPGGSIRDEEVIAAADEHGLAMVFTGTRHFRH